MLQLVQAVKIENLFTMAQFPILPKPATNGDVNPQLLAWSQGDIENRFGFKGGRYTNVNHALAFIIAAVLTAILYLSMLLVFVHLPVISRIAAIYMRPTNQFAVIPATFFFFCGLTILFLKGKKIQFQQRALKLAAVPAEPGICSLQKHPRSHCPRPYSCIGRSSTSLHFVKPH